MNKKKLLYNNFFLFVKQTLPANQKSKRHYNRDYNIFISRELLPKTFINKLDNFLKMVFEGNV